MSRSLLALRSIDRHTRHNFIFTKTHSFWLGIVLSLYNYPAYSQTLDVITIDQNIKTQPLTISGTSGGNRKAIEITQTKKTATGFCDGYVSSQPNHLLQLESFFEYLRLEVQSRADTTVLVTGSGGVWCNDDAGSSQQIVANRNNPE